MHRVTASSVHAKSRQLGRCTHQLRRYLHGFGRIPKPSDGSIRRASSTAELNLRREFLNSSRFRIAVGCITDIKDVDAIVNCANEHLVGTQLPYINLDGSGGCIFECVDAIVHKRAGQELDKACMALSIVEESGDPRWGGIRCPSGQARVTPAFELPHCRYIVHAVGPAWPSSADELRGAYQACIDAALGASEVIGHGRVASIAVPALSSGVHQWPRDMSWAAAIEVFGRHLVQSEFARREATSCAPEVDDSLREIVLAAFDKQGADEAEKCLELWAEDALTEDGLL